MVVLSGTLRDKVTILERTATQTAYGVEEEWTPVRELWGRMTILSISVRAAYNQALKADVTHALVIRHEPTITLANTRVRWRGEDYEVVSPAADPNGRREHSVAHVRKL